MNKMKEHFSSRVTKLLVILALAIVASVMFVIVGCDGGKDDTTVCTNHTWVADTTRSDIAATCDKDGVHYVVCSNCGMASSEVIQATGHHWKDDGALQVEPATCVENGYYYRLCEDCGYRETSSVIFAVGHMLDMNAVTVTPADCTTDGSITGACVNCQESITLQADEIVSGAGDNANVKNFDRATLDKKANEAKQKWFAGAADDTFLQAFGHDWLDGSKVDAFGNLAQPCVENEAATKKAQEINKNDTQKYAGYCERCKTLVPVSDHDKPAGAANCIAAIDNKNMSQADIDAVAPLKRATHAYHCDVCDQDIEVGGHNNQISTLVSGNPLDGTAVYEPVEGNVTSLDCHYYYVCIDCGEVVVATPHTMPLATDTANAENCAHGAKCTVCGLELTRATEHDNGKLKGHMWDSDDETFGTFTYAPATCTTDEQKYDYCTMCKAREDAGEEVKWELGKNYKFVGIKAFNHDDWDDSTKSFEVKTVALDGSTLTNCLTGYGKMDICKRCGAARVSVKPDFYSASQNEKNETVYTKIEKKTDFDKAKGAGNVYTLVNGKYTKIEAAVTWETDKYGLAWTDANGVYGKVTDGSHVLEVMAFNDYEVDQQSRFDQYYKPNCQNQEQVNVLHQCKLCGTTTWDYVSLKVFATKVMGEDSVQDYINSRKDWHAGKDMLVCPHGNSYCEKCAVGNHNAQYNIKFEVVDGINVAIPDLVYYACVGDENEKDGTLGNIHYFAKQMEEFIAKYDGIYEFTFYSVYTDDVKTQLPESFTAWTDIIHDQVNGVTAYEDETVYVVVKMVDSSDKDNKYFNTSANSAPTAQIQWTHYSNENTRPVIKGISFQFSESFIGHENISRIEVTLQRTAKTAAGTETTVYGTVTSTGDQLTALLDSLDYSKVAADPMVTVDVYGLGYNNMNGTVPNGFWTASDSDFIEQVVVDEETVSQYVTGEFELVITMMTNVGTFSNKQTITLTNSL